MERFVLFGAGDEIRTRYLHLGKVALCQMSYARIKNLERKDDYTKNKKIVKSKGTYFNLLRFAITKNQ